MDGAEAVLVFWFAPGMEERWFEPDPAFDAEIERRFGDLVERAAAGELGALGGVGALVPWPCASCSTSSRATSGGARRAHSPATPWRARWPGPPSRRGTTGT